MQPLADFLLAREFVALPLVRGTTGHLHFEHASANGRAATFYLDTGAGRTVIDREFANLIGLPLTAVPLGLNAVGAGGELTAKGTIVERLALGSLALENFPAAVIDLSHVNTGLRARGALPMDGVIGADLLDAHDAVIDYRARCLFLRRPARPGLAA